MSLDQEKENYWMNKRIVDENPHVHHEFTRGTVSFAGNGQDSRTTQVRGREVKGRSNKRRRPLTTFYSSLFLLVIILIWGRLCMKPPLERLSLGWKLLIIFLVGMFFSLFLFVFTVASSYFPSLFFSLLILMRNGKFSMDMPPWGKAPDQNKIRSGGKQYLEFFFSFLFFSLLFFSFFFFAHNISKKKKSDNYPELSYIIDCKEVSGIERRREEIRNKQRERLGEEVSGRKWDHRYDEKLKRKEQRRAMREVYKKKQQNSEHKQTEHRTWQI